MIKETLKVRRYANHGYEVRTEKLFMDSDDTRPTTLKSAYNLKGQYIGDTRMARYLANLGIAPQYRTKTSGCCSIGYSSANKRWYGWSHRAICGFGLKDKIFIANYGDDLTPFVKHGRTTIKNMKQARLAAARFAEYVR